MNTKLLQEQQALLAIAAKVTQRTTLFLHACTLIQEQQQIITRLADHIQQLGSELLSHETKRPNITDAPAVPPAASDQP